MANYCTPSKKVKHQIYSSIEMAKEVPFDVQNHGQSYISHMLKLQKISYPPDPVIKHCKPDKFSELNGAFDGIFSSINGGSSVATFDDWRVFFGVSLVPQLVRFLPFS